ncbi:hypothetical protein AB0469_31615 [Streptomyces sp. NPDC093801]|uniref:hypothetical protein n=1 Tax=Streptomyces sp. NPDC093801 TaxID=3155203 RepID=UPI00344FD4AC
MTRAERLAILGPATIAEIHERVAAAPPPSDALIESLRPILTNPAKPASAKVPTTAPAEQQIAA